MVKMTMMLTKFAGVRMERSVLLRGVRTTASLVRHSARIYLMFGRRFPMKSRRRHPPFPRTAFGGSRILTLAAL